jgi:hypothetical protein
MFFVTCASAALMRAIENFVRVAGNNEKPAPFGALTFPARTKGRCAEPAMSEAIQNAPDTNIPLYWVASPFGKFSEFCCLCVTVAGR